MTAPFEPSVAARAARMDKWWFDRRPKRILRVRVAMPGEFPPPATETGEKARFVILFREDDGSLSKADFFASQMPDQNEPTLAVIFDLVTKHHRDGTHGDIPASEIAEANLRANYSRRRHADLNQALASMKGRI